MRIQGFRGNCDPKASWGCAPALPNQIQVVFLGELLLGIPIFSVRQKGVPPLLLPASMLQLPRCLVRICNLFHKDNQTANWQVSKSAIAAGKTDCKIEFASQMWAARPHLGSIFEKLLHRKTFICLRLVPSSQQYYPLTSQKNRHRNFFRFHDGFLSALSPLLIHIEETEPSRICCKMFIQRCPIRESRVIHREIRGFQSAGIRIGTACYNNIVRTAIHII